MRYLAYIIGALSFVYVLVTSLFFGYVNTSSTDNWETMKAKDFNCPQGTEVSYRGWSENGSLRYCEPLKEGKWEAWMSGYKWVDGNYKNGKKHGKWINYNEDGSITNVTEYNNGVQVNAK